MGSGDGRHVPEDPLDLQDVEGEFLGAHPEGHELDVVAGRGHAAEALRDARAERGQVQQRNEPFVGAGHARPPRGGAAPAGTGRPGSCSDRLGVLDFQTEPAAGQVDQHPGLAPLRRDRRAPSSSAPRCTSGRIRPRTTATPRTAGSREGTGNAAAGIEHLDHLVEREAD